MKAIVSVLLCACLIALTMNVDLSLSATPPSSHPMTAAAANFRASTYSTHPCLAEIIDREDPSWDPRVTYGGGHGDPSSGSYGLPQADPGTKMASAGAAWQWSRWVQLRWAIAYSAKYGGECGAWAFWQAHDWW